VGQDADLDDVQPLMFFSILILPVQVVVWYTERMDYLTVTEAAEALGLTVRGIRDRILRGEMQAERLGVRVWAIPRSEVERWQAIGRLKPGKRPGKGREKT